LKWFREHERQLGWPAVAVLLTAGLGATAGRTLRDADLLFQSGHDLARWIDNVQGGSEAESALFRLMKLPGGEVLFRRPANESVTALAALQKGGNHASLYSLRALEEEQALNFDAAERDWRTWADQSSDPIAAHLDLADFYARRLKPQQEIAALEVVGKAPASAEERWTAPEQQRAWLAWERVLKVVERYGLPRADAAQAYAALLERYPQQKSAYARQFEFLLTGNDFAAAKQLIARYRSVFPTDAVYPIKAEADLATRQGSAKDGLAVYEHSFEPLWPAELVKNYYDLILKNHDQRRFADELRARLAANPDDLKDAARLFYLYQQQGQLDSAKAVLASYRELKEARGAQWSGDELFTFGQLLEAIQDFPDAARFSYALAADRNTPGAEQKGLVGLTRILLTAPEQPLRVGAGNLALYKNIATMDRGPGYLNGILSLLLNTQGVRDEYASEDQLATPYFHRARAAELLAEIDKRFPSAPERAALHAQLMEAYAAYGENSAILREGTALLAQFPDYPERVKVALEVADAYARTSQTEKELAIYQSLLKELSAKADGVPLGSSDAAYSKPVDAQPAPPPPATQNTGGDESSADATAGPTQPGSTARSAQYAQVLDRALARYVALKRLPDALTLLRGELDRNPQDPGLYQRLADFLDQNALNARQEEVYQAAIQQFQDPTWYAKLARFYLRAKRSADYTALTHKVADIFSGTELEQYLNAAPSPGRALALQVNLYAHQRFPHDLRFVENLLLEYRRSNRLAEMEKLLWEHWAESPLLRNELFELLSSTGRLDSELAELRQETPEIDRSDWAGLTAHNPAAERFFMDASLWQSHYESAAGAAEALAAAYPADRDLGEQASSLYRSLAYFHPEDTDKSVAIEKRLLDSDPGNLGTLARIGDIYADRERFNEALPYFLRMADAHPGESDGYLQSATVLWDYFDFPSALTQLHRGRERLAQPTLFGYQIGAIEESRGDVTAAIHEYAASAAADSPSTESRERLLTLARRPGQRAAIEEATAGLLLGNAPSAAAIQLRASVLMAQHRKDDLNRELKQSIAQTSSFDVLDAVTESARTNALPEVEEAALRRQIALTTDPVRNLQLRFQLVDFYGLHKPQSAPAEVDAIYREQGKILGVVRATVDYDWAHGRKPQAVAVLLESADAAYPDLKDRFQLEAARKLTDIGDFAKSRTLLEALLARKPLDAGSETSLADNYARAGDQAGLAAFYTVRLELVRKASLEPAEKLQRVAQLRRGILGAAAQLGNFNDAVDQYVELIKAYPDDAALAQEAALFAVAHGVRDRLIGFYQKAVADSPRDPRWSIVLARLATAAEDYPLAIDAYDKAIHLRPERQDLLSAQADLDEKLHRLDEANFNYRKLYVLSYRDPKWMVKVAELCARQGHNADAVKALETGLIEGRPVKAANSFAVAERLEGWDMLDDARKYAELGIAQAGDDLLVDAAAQNGAATYARILARQRQASAAFTRLTDARAQAINISLGTVATQVIKQGPGAVTDDEWRKQRINLRGNAASQGFAQAMLAMGNVAGKYYTPEEKTQFAAWIQSVSSAAGAQELHAVYLPAIRAAGLEDLNAEINWTLAQRQRNQELPAWTELQQQRGQIESAAARLEKLAASVAVRQRASILGYARDAFHKAGDFAGELRMTQRLAESTKLEGDQRARYYQLLLAREPQELARLAASEDSAAEYLVRNGSADQALGAINARAANKLPVWRSATTALAGLYLRDPRPEVGSAFANALGSEASIGERIALPADRNRQLAGEIWFYYGSRYAEYLDLQKDPRAEDYLESELEHTPENPDAYLHLADYSAQTSRADAALVDYSNSLDLKHDQPAVLDSMASILWAQGKRTEALAAWSDAVKLLTSEIDARRVPESFWPDFTQVLGNVSAHGQYDSIAKQVDALLRIYIPRNGYYRVDSLLEAGYKANHNSIDWLLDITSSAHDQQVILNAILPNNWDPNSSAWIQKEHRGRILARIVELEERAAQQNSGDGGESSYNRRRWCEELIVEGDFAAARAVLAKLPEPVRRSGEWLPDVLAVAEADGDLDRLLAGWKHDAATAPDANDLRNASTHLGDKGRRAVLRFVYERALDARELTAPNFLGLAAIHLDGSDTPGAMSLLRRMTLVSANIYADMDSAAALLEKRHNYPEAMEFLRPLADAEPWNASYKVRLATAMLAGDPAQAQALDTLNAVASDPKAPYADRVAAAKTLKGHGAPASGSGELQLLAQQACPALEDAAKPFFIEARMAAAACIPAAKSRERLLHEALAAAPNNARIRLQYAWAAFAAGFDSRALVAAEPYLQYAPYSYGTTYLATGEDSGAEGGGTVENAYVSQLQGTPNLSLDSLSDADAAKLCTLAIKAWERRRDSLEAVHLAQRALQRIKDPTLRKPFQQTYDRLNRDFARAHENDARAPVIGPQVEWDSPESGKTVRPRLLPGMAFTPKPEVNKEME
jgi:tetratricopeptide (TPR) repeat protein